MPIDKVDINFWEAEYQSLSRLFNNYHQDNYRLPSGLGDNRKERYIPLIAATGGNLNECRRILQESEAMEKSWTVRILSKILT
ncbi:unnamed protein product [Heterobilharzia americana]|nr:unnamed protein product [Heterobilharzia americana]